MHMLPCWWEYKDETSFDGKIVIITLNPAPVNAYNMVTGEYELW